MAEMRPETAQPRTLQSRVTSARVRAVLSLGLLWGFGAIGTMASWTDDATLETSPIQSGELHLDLGDNVHVKPEDYAWTEMTVEGLVPGASAAQRLAVWNHSSPELDLTYQIHGGATESLGEHLQITIRRDGDLDAEQTTCTGGTLLGEPAMNLGNDLDRILVAEASPDLATGQSHDLCIQVNLAQDVPGSLQSETSQVMLRFAGTSVAP